MSDSMFASDPELVEEFIVETTELLENLDTDLVSLEAAPTDEALINGIFRAFHTIKGTAGFLGYEQLVELNHAAEDLLQLFRNKEKVMTPIVMDVLLETVDTIKELMQQVRSKKIVKIDIDGVLKKLDNIKQGRMIKAESSIEPRNKNKKVIQPQKDKSAKSEAEDPDGDMKEKGRKSVSTGSSTMRVDVTRLDDLMNLAGELVLERNRLIQLNREYRMNHDIEEFADKIQETTDKIHFITTELQLSVMKTRMLPIDRLFKKFSRMVRDIAREKKKKVDLIISGGETELEKSVIDQLGDPLVHLIRNSIDHGIESPEERRKARKAETGHIALTAMHEGNYILIHIDDDGRGLNVEKIRQKVIDKEMATASQLEMMTDYQIMQFIFEPGFSTAEQVSDMSGRGVGMDVVKTNIRNLNGMIDLESEPGSGTKFILKLPLTLAVMQALMVQIFSERFAIPLASVLETFRIKADDVEFVNKREVVRYRDTVIPLLYLSRLLTYHNKRVKKQMTVQKSKNPFQYVVLIGVAEKRFGLVVDRLLGQEEVVIKSLGEHMRNIKGIAGGTISGDGRVRLIVDCTTLSEMVNT